MNDMNCLRCGRQMRYIKRENLQLGQTGWVLGDLPNLIAGSLELEIYICPQCGKVEFFTPEQSTAYSHNVCPGCNKVEFYLAETVEEELPQKQCPNCGKKHVFDYPKCPFCKYEY